MNPRRAIAPLLSLFTALLAIGTAQESAPPAWKTAAPGWRYEWPRDHGPHRDFKTEWWYFTGNLRAKDGRRFGYQLTFFRQGVRPPGAAEAQSRFIVADLKFGHFTVTDVAAKQFHFSQQLTRGAFGEAGFSDAQPGERLAWLGTWSLALDPDGSFRIRAAEEDRALELHLVPAKDWVVHGAGGLSIKAEGPGHASHYYSGTRLRTAGKLTIGPATHEVEGESWFDHEWATNQLAPDQAGWDWFSLQLSDGAELMLYLLRKKDGSIDTASSGTFIAADGTARHLEQKEMEVRATKRWRSNQSGADYPIAWQIRIPSLALAVEVTTPLERQELVLQPVTYWEGLVDVKGTRATQPITGHGYVELTGYAGPIRGLAAPQ